MAGETGKNAEIFGEVTVLAIFSTLPIIRTITISEGLSEASIAGEQS
jgi:hypothetical protein